MFFDSTYVYKYQLEKKLKIKKNNENKVIKLKELELKE